MSMLSKILAMPRAELKSRLQAVDASAVKGRGLRRKFEKIRGKQGGFTLLELLVVVLILAAISGTATIMLQDTDRRAAAGAHVAMMDELAKGILTYRVLNQNKLPNVWDSLLYGASDDGGKKVTTAFAIPILSSDLYSASGTANIGPLSAWQFSGNSASGLEDADVTHLSEVGITHVRVVNPNAQPEGANAVCGSTDTSLKAVINDKNNDVTAQNIFRTPGANGCGYENNTSLAVGFPVLVWTGNQQRVGVPLGQANRRLIAFGVGADSTLFESENIGAMTGAPVYRHVEKDEYNRFIVLFNVGKYEEGDYKPQPAVFQAIIDGAGDTKDEELGEIDNVRPT
jgi:prepilin-type N-terminal cleavage/methylation domain-containing protein